MKTLVLLVVIIALIAVNQVEALEPPPSPVLVDRITVKGQLPLDPQELQELLQQNPCALELTGTSTVVVGMDLILAARYSNPDVTTHTVAAIFLLTYGGWRSGRTIGIQAIPQSFRIDRPDTMLGSGKEKVVIFFSGRLENLPGEGEDGLPVSEISGNARAVAFDELGLERDTFPGVPFTLLSTCPTK